MYQLFYGIDSVKKFLLFFDACVFFLNIDRDNQSGLLDYWNNSRNYSDTNINKT